WAANRSTAKAAVRASSILPTSIRSSLANCWYTARAPPISRSGVYNATMPRALSTMPHNSQTSSNFSSHS
ncbi:hypothetical protein M513_14414, partial [Trichuris suis]